MQTLTDEQVQSVKNYAAAMRREIIKMITEAQSGHPGGSLSIADVVALLYDVEMNASPQDPHNPDRDRLVLSKGHGQLNYLDVVIGAKDFSDFSNRVELLKRIVNSDMELITSIKDERVT